MRTQTVKRSWPSSAVLALLVLTGCVAASPSPSPSASPTPSPDIDVAALFLESINAPDWTAKGDIDGSLSIGPLSGEITGEFEQVGADYRNLITVAFAGQAPVTTEQVSVSGTTYERMLSAGHPGVWMARPPSGTGGPSPFSALDATTALEEAGTEERDGQMLYRLVLAEPVDFEPTAFGFTDPSIEDFAVELAFLAESDGTPTAMILVASWTQNVAGAPAAASFEFAYDFISLGGLVRVEAPEDVWVMYVNADYGYAMAHPKGWDVTPVAETAEFAGYDLFLSPVAEEVRVYHYPDLTADILEAVWFRDSAALLEERFGVPLETNEELTAGGLSARLFSVHGSDESGEYFFHEAVVFGSGIAWDIDWISPSGDEAADRERFAQFLSTFRAEG